MGIKNKNNEYIVDILNFAAEKCPEVLIKNSEEIYHAQLFHTVLSAGEKRAIFIAGPSASGKTTTAIKLKEELRHIHRSATVISLDDFYKHRKDLPIVDGKPNAEIVESLELPVFYKCINELLETGKAKLPRFDFYTGIRTDDAYELDLGNEGVLIVEGIHGLNPLLFQEIDPNLVHKVYVSPHSGFALNQHAVITKRELRFLRRMVRDSWSRGNDCEKTFSLWGQVCEAEDKYIRPLGASADSSIDTTHAYEPLVIKNSALVLLDKIPKESEYHIEAQYLIERLNEFKSLSRYLVPTDSMLNEFIKI